MKNSVEQMGSEVPEHRAGISGNEMFFWYSIILYVLKALVCEELRQEQKRGISRNDILYLNRLYTF